MTTDSRLNHLVLFVHGHNGHPHELTYVSTQLQQMHPERVIIHLVTSFDGKTNIGVDKIGPLVAREIEEYVSTLLNKGITIKYISFVGHSLGGLVSRYAIGLLYAKNFFDDIKPMNFTTFATPHVGIRKLLAGFSFGTVHSSIFNFIASSYVGTTGAQVLLEDNYKGRPLLVAMAEEDSNFMRALQLFPHKSLYANVTLDYLVPYYTAALSDCDFATGVHPCITGYEPVVFDVNRTTSGGGGRPLRLPGSLISTIKSLNGLGWAKYPVHIHKSWVPHTAILVSKVWREDTCEGKVVVNHYKDHFVVQDDK